MKGQLILLLLLLLCLTTCALRGQVSTTNKTRSGNWTYWIEKDKRTHEEYKSASAVSKLVYFKSESENVILIATLTRSGMFLLTLTNTQGHFSHKSIGGNVTITLDDDSPITVRFEGVKNAQSNYITMIPAVGFYDRFQHAQHVTFLALMQKDGYKSISFDTGDLNFKGLGIASWNYQ